MEDMIKRLKEIAKEKKLIPFIGAGFSSPLGLPSWNELIRKLANNLDWDPDVFMQSGNNNYLQLAEYYVIKKSIGELRHELSKCLIIDDNKVLASESHKYLVELYPNSIYTTNYDEGIERAFQLYEKEYSVIRNINDFRNANNNSARIYKFHGDFIEDNSLVLTESSYFNRMAFEDPLDIRLRSDILNNTLLFLGYSLSDINTRFIFYKLAKINKEIKTHDYNHSAIMVTFGISEIQKAILSKWDVEVIELNPVDKTKSLADFLKSIIP
jgi:SIR2-like protein